MARRDKPTMGRSPNAPQPDPTRSQIQLLIDKAVGELRSNECPKCDGAAAGLVKARKILTDAAIALREAVQTSKDGRIDRDAVDSALARIEGGRLDDDETFEEMVRVAKKRIMRCVEDGKVPPTCKDFAELHDYIDANVVNDDSFFGVLAADAGDNHAERASDFHDRWQNEINRWIKGGALRAVKALQSINAGIARKAAGR